LRSFGLTTKRNKGASVGSLVKAQIVDAIGRIEIIVLRDDGRARLPGVISAPATVQSSPGLILAPASDAASMNA